MIYQCWLINHNKCTTLAGGTDSRGKLCVWWQGAGIIWEISVLSTQFCCEPKTAFKNKIYCTLTILQLKIYT